MISLKDIPRWFANPHIDKTEEIAGLEKFKTFEYLLEWIQGKKNSKCFEWIFASLTHGSEAEINEIRAEINNLILNSDKNCKKNEIFRMLAASVSGLTFFDDKGLSLEMEKRKHLLNKNFVYLSARLVLLDIFIESCIALGFLSNLSAIHEHGLVYPDFQEYLSRQIFLSIYSPDMFSSYSTSDIRDFSSVIVPTRDEIFEFSALRLLKDRYMKFYGGIVCEFVQFTHAAMALANASNMKQSERIAFARRVYFALSKRLLSPSTPVLLHLRSSGNLASCFILKVGDSVEQQGYALFQIGNITKRAGGIGINITDIRGSGSYIRGKPGLAVGVAPFVRSVNSVVVAVNQAGVRSGAITVALDVWHIDIPEILDIATEKGEMRRKAFDIFLQIVVPDLFIKRLEKGSKENDWTLFDPHEVYQKFGIRLSNLIGEEFEKVYQELENSDKLLLKKKISTRSIAINIMQNWLERGTPYITMKDRINRLNPNKHDGIIYSGNLCQESFSNFSETELKQQNNGAFVVSKLGLYHTCNLTAINLASFIEQYGKVEEHEEEFRELVHTAVDFVDNLVDISEKVCQESYEHNRRYRTIGIGTVGYSDYIAKCNVLYEQSVESAHTIYSRMAYFCLERSNQLAIRDGKYQAFAGSEWSKGIFFGKTAPELFKLSKFKWDGLIERVKKYGLKHSQLLIEQPNTNTSIYQGCSASVLPRFSKVFVDKNSKGVFDMPGRFYSEKLENYSFNVNLDQKKVVDILHAIQEWKDQGISSELCINLNSSGSGEGGKFGARDIFDVMLYAMNKLKTIYYVRIVQVDATANIRERYLNTKNNLECESCSS